jgi:hypothetical protein
MSDDSSARSKDPAGESSAAVPSSEASEATTTEELVRIAREGDSSARFAVAADDRMPVEGLAVLAHDPEEGIRGSVLTNAAVPTEVLQAMLESFPRMLPQIATHPNAPVDVMESVPLFTHTYLSLDGFLRRRAASSAQRDALLLAHAEAHTLSRSETLGEAWQRIGTQS